MAGHKVHQAGEVPEKAAPAEDAQSVVDATGRRIVLRKPSILQQFNVLLAVGPDASANQAYMTVVTPILWVREIDGEKIPFPATKLQLDGIIQRLDEPGVAAVMAWFDAEVQRAASAGAAAKN